MIKQVSWAEYCSVLAVLTAAYYFLIILIYYRNDAWQLLSGQRKLLPATTGYTDSTTPPLTDEQRQYEVVNELVNELKPLFEKSYIKEEMVMALQIKLMEYPQLKGTAFQVAVNNYIQMESENKCSVYLSEDELKGLWQR